MFLDHERLDVYLVALDFVVFANEVVERTRNPTPVRERR